MPRFKNIQVIDGADNCSYSIFQATEAEFAVLFPEAGQDIEYAEDLFARRPDAAETILSKVWQRPIKKQDAMGIHGTLFHHMAHRKAHYAGKRDRDIDPSAINQAQRRLYGKA